MEYIKQLKEFDELKDVLDVQRKVWEFEDIEIIPAHVLRDALGLMNPNGIILGYFVDEKLIAYILTFPTSDSKEIIIEMLAVLPEHQGKGIGYKLSLELRKIMLDLDVNKIIFTYDPLESVNANLYIKKLGGIITHHFINYYGAIDSKTHSGIPTDRFKIEWNIRSKHVDNKLKNGVETYKDKEDVKYAEIPLNFQELKNKDIADAIDLRMKTRKLFEEYVEMQHYIGVDFFINDQKGIYVFEKKYIKEFENLII